MSPTAKLKNDNEILLHFGGLNNSSLNRVLKRDGDDEYIYFSQFIQLQLKLYYKCVNRQLPVYFNCITLHNINDLHQYNTRAATNLFTPRVTHEFAKRCIRYSVIKTVNNSPDLIKNKIHTHSIHGFCCYIKNHYLQNYDSINYVM